MSTGLLERSPRGKEHVARWKMAVGSASFVFHSVVANSVGSRRPLSTMDA